MSGYEKLRAEGLIRTGEAARHAGVTPGRVWRWITVGERGVKLEATAGPGHGWWTSRAAIDRFFDARTAGMRPVVEERPKPRGSGLCEFRAAMEAL